MNLNQSAPEAAEAAVWHVRLRAGDCTLDERKAFAAWLGRDPAHRAAYEQAQLASRAVERLARTDPRLRALADLAMQERAVSSRRPPPGWRAAASVLLAVGVAALLVFQLAARGDAVEVEHFANSGTRQQRIELADGSHVHLDAGAQLEVAIGRKERRLALRAGRAYFDVAHDASRPFSVSAGTTRTVALGTRFEVALAPQSVSVTLEEGSVEVTRSTEGGWKEVLQPGEQLQFDSRSGHRERHEVDTAVVGGWKSGRLVFRSTPLAAALDEINRYSLTRLRLGDESLGNIPIGGTFEAGADSAKVAAALAAALPLDAVQVGATEIVLFRRYETAD